MWLKIILNVVLVHYIFGLDVGDNCQPSADVLTGVCKVIIDCEVALRFIKNKEYHLVKRCGFQGDLEIVCCPENSNKFGSNELTMGTSTSSTRRQSQRKSDTECEKILRVRIPPRSLNIIGGELASIGEFPHMVALGFEQSTDAYDFNCGGTLISDTYVLTAAHCVDTRIEPSVVRMGVVELGDGAWNNTYDVRIAETIKHPNYLKSAKYHDLALLRLERAVVFNANVMPACLYTGNDDPQIPLFITGWGVTSTMTNAKSNFLLKANVSIVSQNTCIESYPTALKLPRGIMDEQMCAGDPQGLQDTCQGDSGGPLQGLTSPTDELYRIVGVTSFGQGCGSKIPGIYIRVNKYLNWIESVVWPDKV